MSTKEASKANCERTYLRSRLLTGTTVKGAPLTEDKCVELWPRLLDLHIKSARPGRAVALLDVQRMMDSGTAHISLGVKETAPPDPRVLSELEKRVIGEWLEKYRAETPSGASEIRATEVLFCPASTVGEGGPPPL
jgi:hypothetical protein